MRSRTPRRIHVDDRDYRWVVRLRDSAHVDVRVWLDHPGGPYRPLVVTHRFDDPWLHYGILLTAPPERVREVLRLEPVKPALVAGLIRAGLAAGWQPEEKGAALYTESIS
ncbi:hypothetical protein ACFV1W_30555 [Kitasatospora sp. NPDC059648]|uniref:hypothetical protein n=1 Tax=Kitasatospora sp. NPDC059648 TaxID=3346894 RepID=UPI00368567C2